MVRDAGELVDGLQGADDLFERHLAAERGGLLRARDDGAHVFVGRVGDAGDAGGLFELAQDLDADASGLQDAAAFIDRIAQGAVVQFLARIEIHHRIAGDGDVEGGGALADVAGVDEALFGREFAGALHEAGHGGLQQGGVVQREVVLSVDREAPAMLVEGDLGARRRHALDVHVGDEVGDDLVLVGGVGRIEVDALAGGDLDLGVHDEFVGQAGADLVEERAGDLHAVGVEHRQPAAQGAVCGLQDQRELVVLQRVDEIAIRDLHIGADDRCDLAGDDEFVVVIDVQDAAAEFDHHGGPTVRQG